MRKQSLTNGQEPGLELTDPAEKPFFGHFTRTLVFTNTSSHIQGFCSGSYVLVVEAQRPPIAFACRDIPHIVPV